MGNRPKAGLFGKYCKFNEFEEIYPKGSDTRPNYTTIFPTPIDGSVQFHAYPSVQVLH
jgi:hypothetical protein